MFEGLDICQFSGASDRWHPYLWTSFGQCLIGGWGWEVLLSYESPMWRASVYLGAKKKGDQPEPPVNNQLTWMFWCCLLAWLWLDKVQPPLPVSLGAGPRGWREAVPSWAPKIPSLSRSNPGTAPGPELETKGLKISKVKFFFGGKREYLKGLFMSSFLASLGFSCE